MRRRLQRRSHAEADGGAFTEQRTGGGALLRRLAHGMISRGLRACVRETRKTRHGQEVS